MIGIIGAMDIEVNGIISQMSDPQEKIISSMKFTSGRISGRECVVAKCGIGKVNAAMCAQTMILCFKPDCIINTGVAGSTSDKTHIGSVVIAENVVQHDFDTTALGDEKGMLFLPEENIVFIPTDKTLREKLGEVCSSLDDVDHIIGNIATGDLFISTKDLRRKLNRKFSALACEMEGGSIGHVCYVNHTPFCILRSISDDDSSENGAAQEYQSFAESAAKKAIEIITAFISS